jgi:hypothetical protein
MGTLIATFPFLRLRILAVKVLKKRHLYMKELHIVSSFKSLTKIGHEVKLLHQEQREIWHISLVVLLEDEEMNEIPVK